jgi:ribonuclease HI
VSQAGHRIDWRWVKGHAGDPGNERADALANLGVVQASQR